MQNVFLTLGYHISKIINGEIKIEDWLHWLTYP